MKEKLLKEIIRLRKELQIQNSKVDESYYEDKIEELTRQLGGANGIIAKQIEELDKQNTIIEYLENRNV